VIAVSKIMSCGVDDQGVVTGKGRDVPLTHYIVSLGGTMLVQRAAWTELEASLSSLYRGIVTDA
jgi:hypothetical protein